MAKRLEELPVFQRALVFSVAVSAIIAHPDIRKNRHLWEQIDGANSIIANMKEGFEPSTDAGFAKYLYHSKGSLAEVLARLQQACSKRYITSEAPHCRMRIEDLGIGLRIEGLGLRIED